MLGAKALVVRLGLAVALTGGLVLAGCGGDDASDTASNGNGGSGASSGSGGSGASSGSGGSGNSAGTSASCSPACGSGTFCSSTGVCIPDGSCKTDQDCGQGGLKCSQADGTCVPGGGCGAKPFSITAQPPNVMIVLDRSGSMDGSVPNSGGKSRWQVASEAIAQLLSTYSSKINFGLALFSACTGNGCAPGVINNPIPASDASINATISGAQLCNSGDPETVIGGTLQGLVGEATLQQAGRDNVVLLVTDGADNCGGGGAQAATALLGQPVPVKTYVIGFSGDVNAGELTAIATAAGTAPYYQADDATQLASALSSIAAGVASCTYQLDQVPPGAGLWVFFNKDPAGVSQDPTNGWSYDPTTNTLTFHGASCDQIKGGTVTAIDVIYSCEKPTPA